LQGVLSNFWGIILTISAPLFFIFDVLSVRTAVNSWRKERKEFKDAVNELDELHDYFIVRVIQVGGMFSTIHSVAAYSNIEGGVYLNPRTGSPSIK
jgi:hypothetical protein